jgi:hypothetical protein
VEFIAPLWLILLVLTVLCSPFTQEVVQKGPHASPGTPHLIQVATADRSARGNLFGDSNINPMADPRVNPMADPMINPMADPKVNPMADPRVNPDADPRISPMGGIHGWSEEEDSKE